MQFSRKVQLSFLSCLLLFLELTTSEQAINDALIRQGTAAGMDAAALAELVRTKQPVVISKTDDQGQTRTTTYRLNEDGTSISSRTVTESRPVLVSTTHTKTWPSMQVSQRSSLVEPVLTGSSSKIEDSTNPENDWEWAPAARRRPFTISNIGGSDFGSSDWPSLVNRQPTTSVSRTSSGTSFNGDWPSRDWFFKPNFELPAGVTPKTTTKTEVDDQGRRVTTTTKIYRSGTPITSDSSWHSFFGGDGSKVPSLNPNTLSGRPSLFDSFNTDDDKHVSMFPTPTPSTPNSPRKVPTPLPLPTRPPTVINSTPDGWKSTTPFPSLDEFLNNQYGKSGVKVTHHRLDDFTTTTKTPRTLATINIDQLPAISNPTGSQQPQSMPIDEDWLRSLSDPLNENVKSTKVTKVSRTYTSASPPSTADLEPQMRDILTRAGITDEDILNSLGNIVRTRTEPDGRVIKTTYSVRNLSAGNDVDNSDTASHLRKL